MPKIGDIVIEGINNPFLHGSALNQLKNIRRLNSINPINSQSIREFPPSSILWELDQSEPNWYKHESVIDKLQEIMNALIGRPPNVRMAAVWVLGRIKDERTIDVLATKLKDDYAVSDLAAWALGEIADKKCVDTLISFLKDTENFCKVKILPGHKPGESNIKIEWSVIREAAIEALGKIGDAKSLMLLSFSMKKGMPSLRQASKEAFAKIVSKQERILAHYPSVRCTSCNLQVDKKYIRVNILKKQFYLLCRGCGSSLDLCSN